VRHGPALASPRAIPKKGHPSRPSGTTAQFYFPAGKRCTYFLVPPPPIATIHVPSALGVFRTAFVLLARIDRPGDPRGRLDSGPAPALTGATATAATKFLSQPCDQTTSVRAFRWRAGRAEVAARTEAPPSDPTNGIPARTLLETTKAGDFGHRETRHCKRLNFGGGCARAVKFRLLGRSIRFRRRVRQFAPSADRPRVPTQETPI
jgi:hypothetical protein